MKQTSSGFRQRRIERRRQNLTERRARALLNLLKRDRSQRRGTARAIVGKPIAGLWEPYHPVARAIGLRFDIRAEDLLGGGHRIAGSQKIG